MHQREVFTTRGLIHNLCSFIGGPTDTLPFRSSFLPVTTVRRWSSWRPRRPNRRAVAGAKNWRSRQRLDL